MNALLSLAAILLIASGGYFATLLRGFFITHPLSVLRAMPREGRGQMLLSLGGTVGVGNIIGVSVAISLGGSGAVFWMLVCAVFAMALKYAEITLGMLNGGAIEYVRKSLGTLAAAVFATLLICDSLVTGALIQANAISEAVRLSFGACDVPLGALLSVSVFAIFFFGVNLFSLSSVLVPLMSVLYIMMSLAVIIHNSDCIGEVLRDIFENALCLKSSAGGVFGFLFTPAMRQGVIKGLFSNEAGLGTAPTAHAASKEKVPARQGLFGIFEVFFDTVIMCSLTALALLTSGVEGFGMGACVKAFETTLGKAAPPLLTLMLFLFAFCTIISFGYYGEKSLGYFTKRGKNAFLVIYCAAVFLGAVATPALCWKIGDITVCLMLIINVSAVLISRREILLAHRELIPILENIRTGRQAPSPSHRAKRKRKLPYPKVK